MKADVTDAVEKSIRRSAMTLFKQVKMYRGKTRNFNSENCANISVYYFLSKNHTS